MATWPRSTTSGTPCMRSITACRCRSPGASARMPRRRWINTRHGMTWNLAPGPTAIPANLAERNAELWASPQGFIKAALENDAGQAPRDRRDSCRSCSAGSASRASSLSGEVMGVRTSWIPPCSATRPSSSATPTTAISTASVSRWHRAARGGSSLVRARCDRRADQLAPAFEVPAEVAANPAPSMAQSR